MFFFVCRAEKLFNALSKLFTYTLSLFSRPATRYLMRTHIHTHSRLIATVLWGVKIKPFLTEICLFEMYPAI